MWAEIRRANEGASTFARAKVTDQDVEDPRAMEPETKHGSMKKASRPPKLYDAAPKAAPMRPPGVPKPLGWR